MRKLDILSTEGFDWDDGNRHKVLGRHQVSVQECEQIFENKPLIILADTKHSQHEDRFAAFGRTNQDRRIFLIFTCRGNLIRIISARNMNKEERVFYVQKTN